MAELRDVNLKLAENHQESVEIAEKTQSIISDVKSGQSTSINLLDNISGILKDQLKIQMKQAKILEGQRFDNLEAARENRRAMRRNARLGGSATGAGVGAIAGRGLGNVVTAAKGLGAALLDTIGIVLGIKELGKGTTGIAREFAKARRLAAVEARLLSKGAKMGTDIPDFRQAVEADANRFRNNRTRKTTLGKINARAFPALKFQDDLFQQFDDIFGPKFVNKPPITAGANVIELGFRDENIKLLEDLRDPPKAAGSGIDVDVKPDGSLKAGIGKFLLFASNALVAVEALYGAKIANEIRQVEKDLGFKLSTEQVDEYLKATRGFKSLEEVLNERSDPANLAGEGNYMVTRLINNIMSKSKMFDPEITQADQNKAEEIISNSVANGFRDGIEQAIKENNITMGPGAIGDIIIDNNTGNNSDFNQTIDFSYGSRGTTGDRR